MLILTRKLGEAIAIGDEVKVHLLEIKGRQVRIGVEAPPHITVHREEIYGRSGNRIKSRQPRRDRRPTSGRSGRG